MKMDSLKATSKKIMINYGLILGVISILISVLNYVLGSNMFQPHWSVQLTGFIISIILIVYGLKEFKKANNGYLKLGEALKIGIGITLISALLGVIYFVVFAEVIEPTFFEQYIDFSRDAALEKGGATPEQIEQGLEMSKPFMNTGFFAGVQLVIGLFFGFIISLIAGLIMKKDNPYEDS